MRRPNRASSARRQKPDKPSQRIQRIELNEHEEQRIQNLYAPLPLARNPNISIRHLDLNQLRQLARANRQPSLPLPTLASLCATVAARTFPTWILPSQDTFQRAKHAHHRPSAAATTSASPPKKRRRTTRDANRPFGATTRLDQDHSGDYVEPDGKATDGATRTSSRRSKRTRNDAGPSAQSPSANTSGSTSVPSDAPLLLPDELEQLTRRNAALLKMLPSQSSFALFQAMCLHCPEMLSRAVVSTYFLPTAPSSPSSASSTLRAPRTHVLMPASLPLFASGGASDAPMLLSTMASALSSHAARSLTNAAVFGQAAFSLTSLQLHGLTGLKDPSLVRLFTAHLDATDKTRAGGSATTTAAISDAGSRGPLRLEVVSLKGCVRIGDAAVAALCGGSGSTLKYLNLDCTDITAKSLEAILVGAPQIETLKLGDVDGLTDDTVPPAVERASETALACRSPFVPLSRLTNLRLRRTQVGDLALGSLLKHCARTLQRLDVSYSLIGSADGELDVLAFALGLDAARGRSLHRRCAGMRNELTGGSVLEDDSWIKDLLDGGRGSAQAVDFDGAAGGASASTTAPPQRRGRGRRQQEQQQQKQRQQQQQAAEVAAREAPPRCDLIKLNISGLTLTPLGLGSFLFSLCAPSRIDEEPLDDESGADHARQRGDGNGTGHRDGDGDGDGGHEGESGKRGAAGAAGTPSPPVPPAAVGLHTLLLADLRRPDPSSTQSGRRGVQWDDDDVVNILVPLYLLVKHRRGRGFKSVSLAGTEVIASFVCAVAFMPAWLDIERLLVRDDMGDMLPTAFMACLVAFLAGCCERLNLSRLPRLDGKVLRFDTLTYLPALQRTLQASTPATHRRIPIEVPLHGTRARAGSSSSFDDDDDDGEGAMTTDAGCGTVPLPGGTRRTYLAHLDLSDTKLDDDLLLVQLAAPRRSLRKVEWYDIGLGGRLQSLNLANTGVQASTLDEILSVHPFLSQIDLTSCRGIPVTRRRTYFSSGGGHEEKVEVAKRGEGGGGGGARARRR